MNKEAEAMRAKLRNPKPRRPQKLKRSANEFDDETIIIGPGNAEKAPAK